MFTGFQWRLRNMNHVPNLGHCPYSRCTERLMSGDFFYGVVVDVSTGGISGIIGSVVVPLSVVVDVSGGVIGVDEPLSVLDEVDGISVAGGNDEPDWRRIWSSFSFVIQVLSPATPTQRVLVSTFCAETSRTKSVSTYATTAEKFTVMNELITSIRLSSISFIFDATETYGVVSGAVAKEAVVEASSSLLSPSIAVSDTIWLLFSIKTRTVVVASPVSASESARPIVRPFSFWSIA